MQAIIKGIVVRVYASQKSGRGYTTLVDTENGEKIVLVTDGVPDLKGGEIIMYEGQLVPLRYGYKADGTLRRLANIDNIGG